MHNIVKWKLASLRGTRAPANLGSEFGRALKLHEKILQTDTRFCLTGANCIGPHPRMVEIRRRVRRRILQRFSDYLSAGPHLHSFERGDEGQIRLLHCLAADRTGQWWSLCNSRRGDFRSVLETR